MLKNLCVQCDQMITAPDDLRGQEVPCQNCGSLNVLINAESAAHQSNPKRLLERHAHDLGPVVNEQTASVKSLHDLSDLLLLFAYIIALLLLAAGATPFFLGQGGQEFQILCFISGAISGILVFITFKFLSGLLQAVSGQLAGQILVQEQLKDILMLLREEQDP
jgi:hypothetical protein